jgi:hypothetical protein
MRRRERQVYEAGADSNVGELPAAAQAQASERVALHEGEVGVIGAAPVSDALAPASRGARPALGRLDAPLAQGPRGGPLDRLQAAGHAMLADGAWRMRQLGSPGLVGIGLLVGAAVLYAANTLPQGKAISELKLQMAALGSAGPGGASAPQVQLALGALPTRDQATDVVGRIYEEAQAAGVELPRGQYEFVPARDGVAAHYRMTFPLHAAYPQLRQFMDRTLIALPSVAVEGLRLERKNVGDEAVDAELKLSAFVREGD